MKSHLHFNMRGKVFEIQRRLQSLFQSLQVHQHGIIFEIEKVPSSGLLHSITSGN